MAKLVETVYGDALFELALEQKQLDLLFEEAKELRQIFLSEESLLKFLNHPKVKKDEKVDFVENVFKGRISDEMMGTLLILVKKDRQNDIVKILDYFEHKVKAYKQIGIVSVTSAVELNSAQKEKIEQRLLATTSYREIEAHYQVDASLIGGLIIRIEDRVVDSSVKTQLASMKKALLKAQIN